MGLIGAALGAGASIFGGIKASQAMKRVKENLEQQQRENQDLYDRRYNEDATQRADAQRILQMTEQSIKNRNRQAAATAAVMGGTDESVAAAKAANSDVMANAAAQITAAGEARKDTIEQNYLTQKRAINNSLNQQEKDKANAITQAVKGVADAAGSMDFGGAKMFGKSVQL